MQDKKSKGRFIHLSISMRLGTREGLDALGAVIEEHTGVDANRSKLLGILANLAHKARDDLDYSAIHDDATLQHELERAILRRLERERKRWQSEEE